MRPGPWGLHKLCDIRAMPDGDDGLLCGRTADGAGAQTARAGLHLR